MGGTCGKGKYTPKGDVLEEKRHNEKTEDLEQKLEQKSLEQNISENAFLVGDVSSVRDDKFTEVKINEQNSVLVAKKGSEYFAIGSKCPHAGAPLSKGVLINGKVRCPWHAACFDIKTGDLEDFPGFDCIPSYRVNQSGTNLYVEVDPNTMVNTRQKAMTKMSNKAKSVVIIGSGPSGYSCAQTLREEGYDGRITMVTSDAFLPYDRTKLTKKLGCQIDDIQLRNEMFYEDNGIDVLLEATVESVDVENRTISFLNNSHASCSYDSLYIAPGIHSRRYNPSLPGESLENIYTLHTLKDCLAITEKAKDSEIVLIGSSFVAMELAEVLSSVASKIHILSRGRVPYSAAFGEPTGEALLGHFLQKLGNVTFHSQTEVGEFGDSDGQVSSVVTTSGDTIACQLAVIAIGGVPNTGFLENSGIEIHPKSKAIIVNEYLETNCSSIYAGGDAVTYTFDLAPETHGSVAHWQLASRHGKIAALNILRRQESAAKVVPFFWTNVCGLQVRFTGYAEGYDETLLFGSTESLYFCVVFRRNQRLIAVCCVGCDNLASELALIFQDNMEWTSDIPEAITKRFPIEE